MSDYGPFYRCMADHYRAERDRADKCLGDIVQLVCQGADIASSPAFYLEAIAKRLQAHYERNP